MVTSVVTSADLRHLAAFSHERDSNYRHVYRSGRYTWRAVVEHDGKRHYLGSRRTEREAAALVVAYMRDRYGPDWADRHQEHVRAGRRRQPKPYRVKQGPTGQWLLTVWIRGVPHPVFPRRAVGFPDRDSALAFYRRWVFDTFGLFASVELWRKPARSSDPRCDTGGAVIRHPARSA